jgi:hypothetical protein
VVTKDTVPTAGGRFSRSAKLAREEEMRRIERMTPRERILLALRLGRRTRLFADPSASRG